MAGNPIKGAATLTVNILAKVGKAQGDFFDKTGKRAQKAMEAIRGATGVGAASMGVLAATGASVAGVMLLTVGAASKFETAFAGIRKTVEASEEQFGKLQLQVRSLAQEIPISTSQLASIGELGGQLGVSVAGLDNFIETIGKLGVATRMSTESAALGLARMSEIFELQEQDIENLASSLVDLGNNFAALEDEIMNTALRLAAGGKVAGSTAADVLGIATALQAVGVQSQAGGTAFARIFQQMSIAAQGGKDQLDAFSRVMQITNEEVRELVKTDPSSALILFVKGLQRVSDEGGNVVNVLEELDLKQQRTIRALLAVAEAGDLLEEAINRANIAYKVNTALNEEAEKRFETLNSEVKLLRNSMTEFRIEIGNLFLPVMKEIVQGLSSFVKILTPAGTATDNYARTTRILVGSLLTLNTVLFVVGRSFAKLMLAYRQAASLTAGLTFKNWLLDDSYTLLSKGARRLGKAIAFLRTNMMALFLGITAVLSVVMVVANEFAKAREAAQKFVETTSIALPLQKEILELEQKIQGLKDEGAKDNLIEIYENRLAQLREINAELDEANLKSFVQATGIDNVSNIGPDTEAFDAFLKEQASLIKSGEKSMFMSRYAQMLEVDMDTALAIAESGTSALIKTLARFEKQQIQVLGNIATQDKGVAFNLFSQAFTRMGKKDMENIKEGLEGVVTEFNELDESIRGPETSLVRIQESTTEWNRVLEILFDTSEDGAGAIESVNEKVLELALGMEKASDATAVLVTDISQLGKLSSFSAREMIEGTEKVEERMLALNELVLLLTEQGFPALGKAALDKGPVEGIQMAVNFLSMSNDMREREVDILVKSNSEYADYTNLQDEVVTKLRDNLTLTQGIATEQERINALLNVQREIAIDRAQDELAAVKELFDMSQARISAEEKIADARENLANLTRDLVYDNITITQAQMMQVELNEAILDFQEAIREFGEEGVVTAHEELEILQKTLALDKMRDKLSATMTARERKRIRDKEKEVKFLKLAVEQGVAEQLDLDAAQEELDELRKPMSDAEREILELEEQIATAELAILEARKETLSPEVIGAMKNVVKITEEQAKRDVEVAKAQDAIAVAITEANILYAQQALRIDELTAKYGPLDDLIYRVGLGIGIPGQILANTVKSMDESYAKAKDIIDKLIIMQGGIPVGPSGNVVQGPTFTPGQTPLGPQGRSQGIVNQFGLPWGGKPAGSGSTWLGYGGAWNPYNIKSLNRAYGGKVPMGRTSTVGELGPESIMSLPGGGTMVFPNKMGGGRGISVANLNVNITGLPADPITARKVALNIRKELVKLDKEGSGGTGLRNR